VTNELLRISKGASLPHTRFSQQRLHCSKLVTLKPVIFTFVIPSEANDLCTLWQNRRGQRGLAPEFLFQDIFTGKPLRFKMLAGSDRVRVSKVLRMNIVEIKKESEKVLAG
jgi:hypothetical protein